MFKEPVKIILRRFRDRTLESGLLIIAVALGIGAFAAGLSLIMNTMEFSNQIMSSPEYRELVISTRSEASEMENPVEEKLVQENAVLTAADLEAANLAPGVEWAYVQNNSRLHLITADTGNMRPPEDMSPPGGDNAGGGEPRADDRQGIQISEEELAEMEADSSIIIAEFDEISGYEVTSQFFNSWDITASSGSLISEADITGTENVIVLGSELAALLAGESMEADELLGKKLLSREGYQTIIGIMNPVSEGFDQEYFSPYKDETGGFSGFRRRFMDTQLRFAVEDPEDLDSTAVLLSDWFESQLGEDQVVISNPRAEAEQLVSRNTGISLLILFLSAAGFFIALVNVSNIMMSRVLRMKKNVGILMALGASKNSIRKLFLTEALVLAVSGGIAGALLAIPLSGYMETAAGIEAGSWLYITIGAVLAGGLTTLFGLIPSRQFMKIDPAQAMRSAS
ncbi:MAG: ABC transporter permease [Spirochaetales bacterium]|uniref:ABC transporter permease n=1 Tax=Candidatus Thalassospirochaeta sargassi TaxID=3119039 RepID=A0AAJ1IF27_9SPIO|nr:ABC transporter permease [Spirochaetales bacterium]